MALTRHVVSHVDAVIERLVNGFHYAYVGSHMIQRPVIFVHFISISKKPCPLVAVLAIFVLIPIVFPFATANAHDPDPQSAVVENSQFVLIPFLT